MSALSPAAFLTVQEFSAALKQSAQTTYRQIRAGQVKAVRIGAGDYRIHVTVLEELERAAIPKAAKTRRRLTRVAGDELAAYRVGARTNA